MNNNELARCFAAYMPCMAVINEKKVYLIGVNWGENEIYYADLTEGEIDYDALPDTCHIAGCKLILKPLSEISDEDAAKADKIANSGREYQELIDYLRSKNYDCGFMDIVSLIDAGIAIVEPVKSDK